MQEAKLLEIIKSLVEGTTTFSETLKNLRGSRYTQDEVARAIGITPAYLNMLETGKHDNPSLEVLLKLIKFYSLPYGHPEKISLKKVPVFKGKPPKGFPTNFSENSAERWITLPGEFHNIDFCVVFDADHKPKEEHLNPQFKDNDILTFQLQTRARHNDIIAFYHEDQFIIGLYKKASKNSSVVLPLNLKLEPLVINKVKTIGLLNGHYKQF